MAFTYEIASTGHVNACWTDEEGQRLRRSFAPGEPLDDVPAEALAEIESVWTTEFVADWLAERAPPPLTLDQAKAAKMAAVTALREAVFADGFTPSTGSLAGHTLQCRDVQDRTNWLTSAVGYSAAVQAGHGAVPGATFRTQANQTVVITFAEAVSVLLQGMQMWGQQIMARSWTLKDQIDAAEDQAALDAIDITAGWPS